MDGKGMQPQNLPQKHSHGPEDRVCSEGGPWLEGRDAAGMVPIEKGGSGERRGSLVATAS